MEKWWDDWCTLFKWACVYLLRCACEHVHRLCMTYMLYTLCFMYACIYVHVGLACMLCWHVLFTLHTSLVLCLLGILCFAYFVCVFWKRKFQLTKASATSRIREAANSTRRKWKVRGERNNRRDATTNEEGQSNCNPPEGRHPGCGRSSHQICIVGPKAALLLAPPNTHAQNTITYTHTN